MSQLVRIQTKISRLRHLDPLGQLLFGACTHRYEMHPVATLEVIVEFEVKQNISLPEDFCHFLLEIGNGGAGPYYHFRSLQETYLIPFSAKPEHLAINYQRETFSTSEWKDASSQFQAGMEDRALVIGDQGCSLESLLILSGKHRGEVWSWDWEAMHDALVGFWPDVPSQEMSVGSSQFASEATNWQLIELADVNPFKAGTNFGMLFLDWYEYWLDAGLSRANAA